MSRTPFPERVSKLRIVATALVALTSVTAAAGSYAAQASEHRQLVTAIFRDVSPMLVGNDVKIHGVRVGTVAAMVEDHGMARVTMEVGAAALPLHSDAKVLVRPVSLLGERYMDLDSGSPNAPILPPNGVIPASQTGQNTDIDEVLDVLDDKTGRSLAAMIAVLGNGMRGNGADIDAAVQALMPALTHTDQFVHTLAQQNATLNDLVDYLQPVTAQLAIDNGKTLDHLVGTTTSLLHTTTTNVTQLRATLDELPSSLVAARNTLGNLADTAENTYPLLRDIRPTTDHLNEISDELENFSDSADPALEDLVPLLHKGTHLLREAQPVARRLRDAGPDIIRTSKGLRPITQQLAGNVNNVLNFIRFWALTTNGRDGLTHYFRAHIKLEPSTVSGNVPGHFNDFGIGGRDPAADSGQPPGGPGLPSGLLQKDPTKDGGVTGMNERQESGALGFLTGGEH